MPHRHHSLEHSKSDKMLKKFFTPVSILVLLGGLAGVALVLYAWRLPPFLSTVEMTDNAFVRGYVTTMRPQVSG